MLCRYVKQWRRSSPSFLCSLGCWGLVAVPPSPDMVQKLFTNSHCFQNKIQSNTKWPSRLPLSWSLLPSLPALLSCTSSLAKLYVTRGHLRLPSVPCLVTSPLCSLPVISLLRSQLKHHLPQRPTQPCLLCQVSPCLFPSLDAHTTCSTTSVHLFSCLFPA